MKEIAKCEDCSCKWSRKEASFSAVKTEDPKNKKNKKTEAPTVGTGKRHEMLLGPYCCEYAVAVNGHLKVIQFWASPFSRVIDKVGHIGECEQEGES